MVRIIGFELLLMVSSVFIFRSLWGWLDRYPWLSTDMGLSLGLLAGMTGACWALCNLHQCIKVVKA